MVDQVQYKQYSELDFEKIKSSLKTHLKSQDILKDFEFEGSTLNVILNLLAYNTQYNSYYLNMLASEKFISTAQKRESIVGAANNIGYVPFSRKSSTAYLSFTINADAGYTSSILLPKNLQFSSTIDGVSYTFLTTQPITVIPSSGVYTVTNLEVKEGRFFKYKFNITATDKFLTIPNTGIDTSRLSVFVKQSSTANTVEYTKYTSLTDLQSTSEVYFTQETSNGLFQLYFGDGIMGKALSTGNEVSVEYFVTEGSTPNGAKLFSLDGDATGLTSINFTSISPASSGAMAESIDSIRISAPTNYQAQNRAITELDYETLVKQIYPDAKQVSAVGGEKATPKQYGKVLISILKDDLNILSDKDKSTIVNALNTKYSALTIFPAIVDPYIIHTYINVEVKYANTGITEQQVNTLVFNKIKMFASTDLNSFKYTLRKSKFEAMVDAVSPAILSNTTKFILYINTNDTIISSKSNVLLYNQPILANTLSSSSFTYKSIQNCQFLDLDGVGYASLYYKANNGDIVLVSPNMLSIDYLNGIVTYIDPTYSFYKLALDNASGIKISVEPESDDIKASDNFVIFAQDADINVSSMVDQ